MPRWVDGTAIKRPLPVEDPGLCKHYLLLPFAINSSSHMNCSIIIATGKHQNEGIGNRVRRSHTTGGTSAVMEESSRLSSRVKEKCNTCRQMIQSGSFEARSTKGEWQY